MWKQSTKYVTSFATNFIIATLLSLSLDPESAGVLSSIPFPPRGGSTFLARTVAAQAQYYIFAWGVWYAFMVTSLEPSMAELLCCIQVRGQKCRIAFVDIMFRICRRVK